MSIIPRVQNRKTVVITLALLLLACGPAIQLRELNQKSRVLATGVAVMGEGDYQAFEAFNNLDKLPSYRLESRAIFRDQGGNLSRVEIISEHDSFGNMYTVSRRPDGGPFETYLIDDRTYVYQAEYEGWVELGTIDPDVTQQADSSFPTEPIQLINPVQFVTQLGAVPTAAGHEFIYSRAATRYDLNFVSADLTRTFGNQADSTAVDMQGRLWVDDQTGALLRSEILFYESDTGQPSQEYFLETSRIGSIAAIELPSPVINPAAMISATATAQAWSVLQVTLNFLGEAVDFELVPLQINPSTSGTAPGAEMRLMLRQLPPRIGSDSDLEAFLTELEQQLKLSIPQHNLVVAGNGYRVDNLDLSAHSVEVVYFFGVDLEDFAHVELILSGSGNPIVAAVPVAGK